MEHKGNKIKPGLSAAKLKIRQWCAYQERSQHETRQKLYGWGFSEEVAESLIADLVSENFINEERFAVVLAGGKFRIKRWGRVKIKMELKRHKLSDYCIRHALNSIGEDEYLKCMTLLAEKKINAGGNTDKKKLYHSIYSYLVSRGFENDLVLDTLKQMKGELQL